MEVQLPSTSGLPNGFWAEVRKHFVQGTRQFIQLKKGQSVTITIPSTASLSVFITEIVATAYGQQKLIRNESVSGNNKIITLTSQNATFALNVWTER